MSAGEIRADDVGTAWRLATRAVLDDALNTFHLVVRIGTNPDDPAVQAKVDALQLGAGYAAVSTVSNTIFPAAMAAAAADHDELATRYHLLYPRLRKLRANIHGTYFGRMVDHPGGGPHANQLSHVIRKLQGTTGRTGYSSRYEVPIYHPASDASRLMGFPCLSHCAFHLDAGADEVHLLAVYRNHHMVERAYGNYLGLARLRDYVATQAGRSPGELVVISGHAQVETAVRKTRQLLNEFDALHGAP